MASLFRASLFTLFFMFICWDVLLQCIQCHNTAMMNFSRTPLGSQDSPYTQPFISNILDDKVMKTTNSQQKI